MPELKRVEAVVHGRVQGVGYRDFLRREGLGLGLIGWVRNEPGGTVRFVAEGPKDRIEQLLDAAHLGPKLARVTRIEETWGEPLERHSGFEVRR